MKPERLWALIKYEKWLLRQILAIGRLHLRVHCTSIVCICMCRYTALRLWHAIASETTCREWENSM